MTSSIKHLAVIMDGNGRWAKSRGLQKIEGHRRGAEAARELLQNAITQGIKYLTLYTFSTENWRRPEEEVSDLLGLVAFYLEREVAALQKNGVRIKVIGDLTKLSNSLRLKMLQAMEETKLNTKITICLAFNYGGRDEIVHACRKMMDGDSSISEESFKKYLYDPEMPDVDLMIRTSGERRISNFLLWQIAYAELYFTDVLWPDFGKEDLELAVQDFMGRCRNFGG